MGVKQHKHSIGNQLNPIIKINYKKQNKNKDSERERNSYKIRSGAEMQPGLTTSRPTAGWDIRLDTLGAERIGEVGWANAYPLK